jgi:hypothetical protein
MALSRETLEKRAVKTGVKASIKRHHVVSEQELLALRVQTMPAWLRIALVLLGIALVAAGWFGWPADSNAIQGFEAIIGILAILFGAFGIRRTLERVLDSMDAGNAVEIILELIGDALSCIDF